MSPQKRAALRRKLQKQLEEIRRIKAQAALLDRDRKALQVMVLENLGDMDLNSFSYEDDEGFMVKATRVQATSVIIDESQLKKSLGAKMWNKLTRRVLDDAKLMDAMAEGLVDPVVVATASSEKSNAPYVKITAKASKSKSEEKF